MDDNVKALMQESETLLENNAKLTAINGELTDALNRIAERQSRERSENTVWYALMVDGDIWVESTDLEEIQAASQSVPGSEIYTWTTTPKKLLTLSGEEKVEGN